MASPSILSFLLPSKTEAAPPASKEIPRNEASSALFSQLMKRRVEAKGAARQNLPSQTESRMDTQKNTPAAKEENHKDSPDADVGVAENRHRSDHEDDARDRGEPGQAGETPHDANEGCDSLADRTEGAERAEDQVDVTGHDDPDPTRNPGAEALALGLLVGQAVPLVPPPSVGSFVAAAAVAPATPPNARASASDAPALSPLPGDSQAGGFSILLKSGSAENAALTETGISAAGRNLPPFPKPTDEHAVIPPGLLEAIQTAGRRKPVPDTAVDTDQASAEARALANAAIPDKDGKFLSAPASPGAAPEMAVAAKDVSGDATEQPKRLGKIAPAALKTTAAEARDSQISSLRAQVSAIRSPTDAEPIDAIGPKMTGSPESGSARAPEGSFATQLQNALNTLPDQAKPSIPLQTGVAGQLFAHVATLPRGKGTQFTLRLAPEELGSMDVVMDFRKDGHLQLTIRVESKEALDFLQRDARALEKSLQDMGLKTDEGSLSFSLKQDGQPQGQSQEQGRFGDAERQPRSQSGAHGTERAIVGEDTVSITQLAYSIPRADSGLDIQA